MSFRHIDIHSHLNLPQFDVDREAVIAKMKKEGVATIVVGVDYESSKSAAALATAHENIFACVGLHPADNRHEVFDAEKFEELTKNPKVVAVGECGLDYYRLPSENIDEEKTRQQVAFEKQIAFAVERNLPLMIHGRPSKGTMDAYIDVLEILAPYKGQIRGNVHFFVGDLDIARRFLDLDFTLSFTGVITFARDYDQVIRETPLEMIQSETDSPFAAPIPFRGGRAEPSHVREVIGQIAALKGATVSEVENTLLATAHRIFKTH